MKKGAIASILLAGLLLTGCAGAWRQGEVVVVEDDTVTIQILAGQSTSDAGSEEMIGQVLREKFPGVDFQWTCVDWGDAFASQMTSRFAAGKTPDIMIGKAQDVAVYQELGAILPLPPQACAGVSPKALELVTIGEEAYGLPYNTLYQGVIYNKEIFSELGLSIPRTRQELEEIVNACEDAGIPPFAVHYGDVWAVENVTMQLWMNDLFLQFPQWRGLREEEKTASDALILDAFSQCRYMLDHSFPDGMQIDQAECNKRFAQGEAAMFMTGTWTIQTLAQLTPGLEVGIFPYPNTTGNARLLEETNMTFMKGNTGKDTQLVDQILTELGTNRLLAEEISEFTVAASTFQGIGQQSAWAERESEPYRKNGGVADVSIGNQQIVWPSQTVIAQRAIQWLEGDMGLDQLLQYVSTS